MVAASKSVDNGGPLMRPTRKGLAYRKWYDLPRWLFYAYLPALLGTITAVYFMLGATPEPDFQKYHSQMTAGLIIVVIILLFVPLGFLGGFVLDLKSHRFKTTGLWPFKRAKTVQLEGVVGVGLKTEEVRHISSNGYANEFTRYRFSFRFSDGHDEVAFTSLDTKPCIKLRHEIAKALGVKELENEKYEIVPDR